ncbi:hypothetical protein [Photobacterium phosphoreum]|uniref:hypothetical protein n=1 Tax=Photobacterium phosphoreum TaxID=659 RepID=UPI001E63CD72|nr:hypothetical protein [Photobacterium phosphoreum]MCD9477807.1 hypothetical protein [Photobacterium phosphoreum]
MKHLYEIEKIDTINNVSYISDTIIKRLYSSFDSIDAESQAVEVAAYQNSAKNFDPETMDETYGLEEAFHEGVSHYLVHMQMKQEFLNSSITWLFHQFERDCTRIFQTEDGNVKKDTLNALNVDTSQLSSWKTCNSELRDLANAIKHGEGHSLTRLKSTKPNLFKSGTNQIEVKVTDVEGYTRNLLDFWGEFFDAALR